MKGALISVWLIHHLIRSMALSMLAPPTGENLKLAQDFSLKLVEWGKMGDSDWFKLFYSREEQTEKEFSMESLSHEPSRLQLLWSSELL